MSDIKTYEDIQRGKPVHSDGVMAHIGIVKRVASHLRGRLPEYMDLDELVQVGMIGLIVVGGDTSNKAAIAKAKAFGKSKKKLASMLAKL